MSAVVFIIAQQIQVQAGLKLLLATNACIRVVEAHALRTAIRIIRRCTPGLVLIDIDLSRHALTLVTALHCTHPELPVVVLTDGPARKRHADTTGVRAALIKGYPAHKLLELIQTILFDHSDSTCEE